jgi:uncharacterized protein (TIGR04222 family)
VNPFDLRGPEFLVFYGLLTVVILAALYFWRESTAPLFRPTITISDPYLIAHLRGGRNEALRVATVSLLDRGLLEENATLGQLRTKDSKSIGRVSRTIEKAILEFFLSPKAPTDIYASPTAQSAAGGLTVALRRAGLITSPKVIKASWIAALSLGTVSLIKLGVAISRGRSNILFLILMTAGAISLIVKVFNRPRTRQGESMLEDLRTLFGGASHLLTRGGSEAALKAAVFGLVWLPDERWAFLLGAYREARMKATEWNVACGHCGATASGPSWGGSSCGSSSSCGGGCGGGGCGGGCGGCGS